MRYPASPKGDHLPVYRISSRNQGDVEVEASNWIAALGEGLGRMGIVHEMDRIACEVLPNGQILVRDVRSGAGYVVRPLDPDTEAEGLMVEDTSDEPPAEADLTTASMLDEIEEIVNASSVDLAVRQTMEAALARVPADSGSILLRREDESLAFVHVVGAAADFLANVSLPANTGVVGFSVQRNTTVTVRDAYADPRFFREVDTLTGLRTRSLLCVPITFGGTVYGCVELMNATGDAGFTRDAMVDVGVLADALAQRIAVDAAA